MSTDRRTLDTAALRARLEALEGRANDLPWAAERPWRATTHVWAEGELPVVDLHDLDAKLARDAIRQIAEVPLQTGAVSLVTGVGRHSRQPPVLGKVTRSELAALARERGWRWRPARAGRVILLTDPERAPRSATGELGPWFLLGVLAFLLAFAWAAPPVGIPVMVVAIAFWLLSRR